MIPLGPVVARSRMKAARTDVWSYLADPERRANWWAELHIEPHIGGAVSERWSEGEGDSSVSRDASGSVDVWVEGHAIGFTWREAGDERDTAVLMTLRSQGVETGITVTETGFDALPSPAERAAASQDGWQVLLRDLTAAVEAEFALVGVNAAHVASASDESSETAAAEGDVVASAAVTGTAVAVAEQELDGELDDTVVVQFASENETEVEVDAEPELGEHLELDTGAIDVAAAALVTVPQQDAAAAANPDESDHTVVIDAITEADDAVAEGAEGAEGAAASESEESEAEAASDLDAHQGEDTAADSNEPDDESVDVADDSAEPAPNQAELDFDALIRGDELR